MVQKDELGSPAEFGLQHEQWRSFQPAAIKWASDISGVGILEAPTGSGKTAIARVAAMQSGKSLALVKTKALQAENYEGEYGFKALYGMNNYPCVFVDDNGKTRCDDCQFQGTMKFCPQYDLCEYVMERTTARAADRTTLNYAYWLLSRDGWPPPKMLICDEGHQLSDIVLDWAGCEISQFIVKKYDLPWFVTMRSGGARSAIKPTEPVEEQARIWLAKCQGVLAIVKRGYEQSGNMAEVKRVDLLESKVKASIHALSSGIGEWYIRSGPGVITYKGQKQFGFIARPLTAKHHFASYFRGGLWKVLIMSATIGDFLTFAAEIGVKHYDEYRVPSVWAPEVRSIVALDAPRMGRKSKPADYNKRADVIAIAIHGVDPSWSGLIHVTSKADARRMMELLAVRRLQDRIFLCPEVGTEEIVRQWQRRKARYPNSIMVSWALWEGYNGLDEKINIVAKLPYPFLGDSYEIERRNYNGKFFLQRTAWKLEQGLGRTRRGREEDYDLDGEKRGLVAIADAGWKYVRKYLSASTLEAITDG